MIIDVDGNKYFINDQPVSQKRYEEEFFKQSFPIEVDVFIGDMQVRRD